MLPPPPPTAGPPLNTSDATAVFSVGVQRGYTPGEPVVEAWFVAADTEDEAEWFARMGVGGAAIVRVEGRRLGGLDAYGLAYRGDVRRAGGD